MCLFRSTMSLPTEIWQQIVMCLSPWDALQLRTVSKNYYNMVTTFHSYWYRQFCWFLICQKKRPAMFKTGCHRSHKKDIPCTVDCLNIDQEQLILTELSISVHSLPDVLKTNPEIFNRYPCTNSNHFNYDLPEDRFNIPLDSSDYDPQTQIYCYRFLIHNYRQQRSRTSKYSRADVKRQLKQTRDDMTKQRREMDKIIAQCKRELERTQNRDTFLRNIDLQLSRVEVNKVFYGKKSRQYKGLLGDDDWGS